MKNDQLNELLLQALETEIGGVEVYTAAIECASNKELKEEWEKYLAETQVHVQILKEVITDLGLDPQVETVGRKIVAQTGEFLVRRMQLALRSAEPEAAQLVAAESVVLAETKDHMNWELIGEAAKNATGKQAEILQTAYEQVEQEEDHHVYHTKGWTRELWIESLVMTAVLPPPEEVKNVETAIGAARAQQARTNML
jgi:rubrerythrin